MGGEDGRARYGRWQSAGTLGAQVLVVRSLAGASEDGEAGEQRRRRARADDGGRGGDGWWLAGWLESLVEVVVAAAAVAVAVVVVEDVGVLAVAVLLSLLPVPSFSSVLVPRAARAPVSLHRYTL